MKKYLCFIITVCMIIGSMTIVSAADTTSWTELFTLSSSGGEATESGATQQEATVSVEEGKISVGLSPKLPSNNRLWHYAVAKLANSYKYDVEFTLNVTKQSHKNANVQIQVNSPSVTTCLYIYCAKDVPTIEFNGASIQLESLSLNSTHTYRIVGGTNAADLYIDGVLRAYDTKPSSGGSNPPNFKIIADNGGSSDPCDQAYELTHFEISPTDNGENLEPAVGGFNYNFNNAEDGVDWVNENGLVWKVKGGVLTSACSTTSNTKENWSVYRMAEYQDDFNFHARMRYTTANFYIIFGFLLPGKELYFHKLETVWYYDGATSGSVPYQGAIAPESGEWFDVDVKTYNNCERAKIYINGNMLYDVPFEATNAYTAENSCVRISNAALNSACPYSTVEIDSVSFETTRNSIVINNVNDGDVYSETDNINVSATFSGETAPDEITYYLNGKEYAKGTAPNYSAVIKGLPAGSYKLSAKSGIEASITTSFTVTQSISGDIDITGADGAYSLAMQLDDEQNQVAEVEYLLDGVSVGSSTTAPYTVTIENVSNANHTIGAICKNAAGITVAEFSRTLETDLSGGKISEHFSNEISYTASGNAEYDFGNGMHRLYLKHTENGVTYLTSDGEKSYKLGTGNFRVITNFEFADVYRNGQLAFSYIMPKTTQVYKNASNITNESVKIPEGKNTYFKQKNIGKGEHIYNFCELPYIYQLEFIANKTDDVRLVINDSYYRTDLMLKDGKLIAWDGGGTGEEFAPVERVLCDVPDTNDDVYYRLETSLGMSKLYADGKWLASFRSSRSVGGQYMAIKTGSGIEYASINSATDVFAFEDNFDGAGEFASSEYWYDGHKLSMDENGIALKTTSGGTASAELNVYAGTMELEADVTVKDLNSSYFNGYFWKGGFWINIDHSVDGTYSKIGYNASTKKFEAVEYIDGTPTTKVSQSGSLPYNTKFNIKIKAVQHEKVKDIVLYIGGTEVLKYTKDLVQRGRVGFVVADGSATIHNISYYGDSRPVRGAVLHNLEGVVEPTVEAFDRGEEIVLTSTGTGRAVSSDGGKTFVREAAVTGDGFNVYQFVDENGNPTGELLDLIFFSEGKSENGYTLRNARIYRSLDYGATWTEEGLLLPESEEKLNYRYCGITRGPSGRMYYCLQYLSSEMEGSCLALYSDDKGKTWTKSETYIDFNEVGVRNQETMAVELSDGRVRIYSRNDLGYLHYYESKDGGKTFDKTIHDTPFFSALNCFQIENDPYNPGTMYACWSLDNVNASKTEQNPRTRMALARSVDDGETWEFLGSYFEYFPKGDGHATTNLCLAFTKEKLIINGWLRTAYEGYDGYFDSFALVVDRDKLQSTSSFEQVHMIHADSATNRTKFDASDILVVNPENGVVFKNGEMYLNGAVGRYVLAEIASSYVAMKPTYNADGSVILSTDTIQKTFGTEYVQEIDGQKYILADAFAREFRLLSTEKAGTIVIYTNNDNLMLKKMAAQYTADVFREISQEEAKEQAEAAMLEAFNDASDYGTVKTYITQTYADKLNIAEEDLLDAAKLTQSELYQSLTGNTYTCTGDIVLAFCDSLAEQKIGMEWLFNQTTASGKYTTFENGAIVFDIPSKDELGVSETTYAKIDNNVAGLNHYNFDISFKAQMCDNTDYIGLKFVHTGVCYNLQIAKESVNYQISKNDWGSYEYDDLGTKEHTFRMAGTTSTTDGAINPNKINFYIDGKFVGLLSAVGSDSGYYLEFNFVNKQSAGTSAKIWDYYSKTDRTTTFSFADDYNITLTTYTPTATNAVASTTKVIWATYDENNKMTSFAFSDTITTTTNAMAVFNLKPPTDFKPNDRVKAMYWQDVGTACIPLLDAIEKKQSEEENQ